MENGREGGRDSWGQPTEVPGVAETPTPAGPIRELVPLFQTSKAPRSLEEARLRARTILGVDYDSKIQAAMVLIRDLAQTARLPVLLAGLMIAREMLVEQKEVSAILVLAATCELELID